jgi:protein gp37
VPGHPYEQGFDLRLVPDKLTEPLTWKKPRRVFVNSMSDLFQDGVPDEYIDQVFAVMALSPQHTFQVLTKRAERMREYIQVVSARCRAYLTNGGFDWAAMGADASSSLTQHGPTFSPWPLPNVWLGVSVENQHFADERIPLLLETPAAIRFISAEPLLGDVELERYFGERRERVGNGINWRGRGLDWVIVGGESGAGARPLCLSWVRNIVHDCRDAGVPCFVKQLGADPYEMTNDAPVDGPNPWPVYGRLTLKSRKGGDPAEWEEYLRVREFPEAARQAGSSG